MPGKIGTHNGKFHCDEALACFMLKCLGDFSDFSVVRSRDPAVLGDCDIVVDVGGVFDHSKRRYDHHQKTFNETMNSLGELPFHTKLSSAGLVYAHYGKKIIANIIGEPLDSVKVSLFYHRVYESFLEQIDANDNGIPQYEGTPKYKSSGGICGRVGRFNPHWNEAEVEPDERFQQAMQCVGNEFIDTVKYLANVWWPARETIESAIDKRFQNDPSGRIIVLELGGVPWKEHFFELEEEKSLQADNITYIVYQDTTDNSWRVQAIPTNKMANFQNRLPLTAAWRGLRDEELSKEAGIESCVFVHMSGFIGGNRTREGALEMARKSMQHASDEEKKEETDNSSGEGWTKAAGSAAIAGLAIGLGIWWARRQTNRAAIQNERIEFELDKIRTELAQLRADILLLKDGQIPRSQSGILRKERNVSWRAEPGTEGLPRPQSYASSMTSDGEYVDAEDEWNEQSFTAQLTVNSALDQVGYIGSRKEFRNAQNFTNCD
ncbi:hypothetical protein WR25_25533 [Diploscapter pachys]|uniref:Metal-dependent protein hydrolase n=1 Tax=Diploscapter pachys TaxID=2018661 RepID=A0A2A2JFX4_9BILA|nr:hypothetical protein WR25_25533 [Diploscapter pachys]